MFIETALLITLVIFIAGAALSFLSAALFAGKNS